MNLVESATKLRRLLMALIVLLACMPAAATADHSNKPYGTFYLSLDAEPYIGLAGFSLPGMMTIHADRTVHFADGGDFGGLPPLFARDTAQFGSWRHAGRKIKLVSLFLQAEGSTGSVLAWYRVEMRLQQKNRNLIEGTINVYKLDCMAAGEIPSVLNCPDPIESDMDFYPDGPPDVPITLRRLRPKLSN